MMNLKNVGLMVLLLTIQAGCSTVKPVQSRVNLFETTDFKRTHAGDVVAGMTTISNGVWFSDFALGLLQKEKILP